MGHPKTAKQHQKVSRINDPCLKEVWLSLRKEYFPDRKELDNYTVYWSKRRQIRTLASCNLEDKRISVAKELNSEKVIHWVEPLLYHEMCHAALKYNVSKSKRGNRHLKQWHGPEFKALERRHPKSKELNRWIKSGGWLTAVRSHRAREAHRNRKARAA